MYEMFTTRKIVLIAAVVLTTLVFFVSTQKITMKTKLFNLSLNPIPPATFPDESTPDQQMHISGDTYRLPILNFHNIGEIPSSVSVANRVWYVNDNRFEEILSLIKKKKYTPIFLSELIRYLELQELPERSIVLTFDDGAKNFYTNAFPLLQDYGYKANVMVMTGVRGSNFLSADEIKLLDATGLVEFQSHTRYHVYLTKISPEEAEDELRSSKAYLEDLLGNPAEVIAYPFGLYNDTIIGLAKEIGYKLGLTITWGTEQDIHQPFELKRYNITETADIELLLQ